MHYWVSCAINKGGFLRLHFRRQHTFTSLWGACLCFASLWRTNSHGDSYVLGVHLSSVCWGLLFSLRKALSFKSLLNLRKAYIFQEFAEGVLSICVCWISNVSAAVVPSCIARRPLCHKVNLPRFEARQRHFITPCDIFGTGQTNTLRRCYLFGKTYKQPTVAPLKSLKSTHWTKLLQLLRRTIRYH